LLGLAVKDGCIVVVLSVYSNPCSLLKQNTVPESGNGLALAIKDGAIVVEQ